MENKETYSVKREIVNAIIELMTEKSYMDITVTDIINTAQVARASFYRNFNSINDVIDMIANEMCDELIGEVFPTLYSTDERQWREFLFNHFYRFTRKQRQMGKIHPQNMNVIFVRMDGKIRRKQAEYPTGTIRDKYLVSCKMGLINSVTKEWIDGGMQETPEEMIDYIMSFILKI